MSDKPLNILSIETEEVSGLAGPCLKVAVLFEAPIKTTLDFNYLGKFFPVLATEDVAALEKWEEENPPDFSFEEKYDSEFFEVIMNGPSVFDSGHLKRVMARGMDHIHQLENGSWEYTEFVVDGPIVRAAVQQLRSMKDAIDEYADGDQSGTISSGDVFQDFLKVIMCLDMFWD